MNPLDIMFVGAHWLLKFQHFRNHWQYVELNMGMYLHFLLDGKGSALSLFEVLSIGVVCLLFLLPCAYLCIYIWDTGKKRKYVCKYYLKWIVNTIVFILKRIWKSLTLPICVHHIIFNDPESKHIWCAKIMLSRINNCLNE